MSDMTPSAPPAPANLDLSAAIPTDTAVIDIFYPGTSRPTGWRIELAGPSHPRTVAVGDEAARESLQKEKAIEFAQVNGRKWKTDAETPDERAERIVGRLVRRIVSWSPDPTFPQIGPNPIAFSESAATTLFLRKDMAWALNQIAEYLTSETAFTRRSATG